MDDPAQKPGWGYGVYAPPATASAMPGVILWYRVYAFVMAIYYGAQGFVGFHRGTAPLPVMIVFGIIAALYIASAFIRLAPRGWIIGLVAIGSGLLSCVFPAAVWLLIVWCRPITKAAFGRL